MLGRENRFKKRKTNLPMTCNRCLRVLLGVAMVSLAATTWGCAPAAGSVTGVVTVAGQPVASGQVSFLTKTGMVYTANIGAGGSYKLGNVPPGEMVVLVFGAPPRMMVFAGQTGAAKKFSAAPPPPAAAANAPTVPAKYRDVSTSDLRFTVAPGSNTYDPPLK